MLRRLAASRRSFRWDPHKIVAEGIILQTSSNRPTGRCRLAADPASNVFRQILPVIGCLSEPALGRVGQEPAFDQNRWNRGSTENKKSTTPDAAIFRRCT